MGPKSKLDRILRVRTLQLGLVQADEARARDKANSEALLRGRIAQLVDNVSPSTEAMGGFSLVAAAHFRERLHQSAEAAENRMRNAAVMAERAAEATKEARRDQSAVEKLIVRAQKDLALREIRELQNAPDPEDSARSLLNPDRVPTPALQGVPMPEITSAMPSIATMLSAPLSGAGGAVSSSKFGQTLGAFLDAQERGEGATQELPGVTDDRQDPAEDGKGLPDTSDATTAPTDASEPPPWLQMLLPPLPPAPVVPTTAAGAADPTTTTAVDPATRAIPASVSVGAADSSQRTATLVDPTVSPRVATALAALDPGLAHSTSAVIDPPVAQAEDASPRPDTGASAGPATPVPISNLSDSLRATPAQTVPASPIDTGIAQALSSGRGATVKASAGPVSTAATDAAPVALARMPAASTIAVSAMPMPAGQVFAAAMATANEWRERSTRTERDATDGGAALFATAPTAGLADQAVQATGAARNAPFDLTKDTGLQHMIDRIETLRDDADSRDTRIRLTPDALGSVDISVRQQGDAVHVHFAAENDATRALIADTQARLTELAAERGVRLSGTSVGGGGAGDSAAQQQQARATVPTAPPSVTRAVAEADIPTDQRLA